jgi:Tfp pilus assembly protein PilZ
MNPSGPSVEESRSAKRYIIDPPLQASLGSATLTIIDAGETGVQAEHAVPVKLGATARLLVQIPGVSDPLKLEGRVVWSRLSKKPNEHGKYLYRSGIRVENAAETIRDAVEKLHARSQAEPDHLSLMKKETIRKEKQEKLLHPQMKMTMQKGPQIPTDQLLLIHQARERLQSQPDEAVKWYNRAKFSLTESGQQIHHRDEETGQQIHHRDEVLAVWEYLERTIDINVIARAFDEKKGP